MYLGVCTSGPVGVVSHLCVISHLCLVGPLCVVSPLCEVGPLCKWLVFSVADILCVVLSV